MANTTFSGTVRAESGLKVSAKAAATGAYTDKFTVSCAGAVCASSTLAAAGATSLATTARMTVGTGISAVSNAIVKHSVITVGNIIETTIALDLTGLNSSAAADIIGKDATANCHYGQITAAVNGTVLGGKLTCLEAPAGGDPDINLWYADEATGTEDAAVTGLTNQVQVCDSGDLALNSVVSLTTVAADKYLYMATGAATNADYTAGKLLIEFWGYTA